MKRRITLSVLAALILALVGLPTTAHYRAKRRAEAYRLQLKASGEPTKVADFRPVLSPEEVRTGAELVAAANRFRLVFSNAPTMKFLAPGRALAACRVEVLPTDESANIWPGLEFLLAQNEDALARVRAALAGSTGVGFHLDYSVWPNLPLSHLANMKAAAQWLSLSATVELHAGRITNAWEDLDALARLVTGYSKEPLMISELVRLAMAAISINATWEALQCAGWNDQQLRTIQDQWQGLDLLLQAELALASDRVYSAVVFEAGRRSYGAVNFQPGAASSGLAQLAQVGKEIVDDPAEGVKTVLHRYPAYWGWKYWQSYDDEIANGKTLQAGIEAVRHARAAGIPALAASDFETAGARLNHPFPAWLGYSAFDNVLKFLTRIRGIEIQRALLIGAIALKRYELKHGRYPAQLGDLSPEFVTQLPRDPMDGNPLRYRLNSDGTFLLYSIGENGRDNGGDPEPLKEAPRQWWRAHDAVWPWPATSEQVQAELRRATEAFYKTNRYVLEGSTAKELEAFRRRYGLLPPAPGTNSP